MSQVIECYSKINNDLFYDIITLISEMESIKLKEKNEKNEAKKERAEKKRIKSHINQQNQELENQLNQYKEKEINLCNRKK